MIELNVIITQIDLSKNQALIFAYLRYNNITELDVSKNVNLKSLGVDFTPMSELDVINCPKLVDIVENCERDEIGDRKAWDGDDEHEGQIQIPLKCKLIYK